MEFKHIAFMVVLVLIGYAVGARKPSLIPFVGTGA